MTLGTGSSCVRLLSQCGGASIRPWFRFPPSLIEPDVRIYRIRLSDWIHARLTAVWPRDAPKEMTPSDPNTRFHPKARVPRVDTLWRRRRKLRIRS